MIDDNRVTIEDYPATRTASDTPAVEQTADRTKPTPTRFGPQLLTSLMLMLLAGILGWVLGSKPQTELTMTSPREAALPTAKTSAMPPTLPAQSQPSVAGGADQAALPAVITRSNTDACRWQVVSASLNNVGNMPYALAQLDGEMWRVGVSHKHGILVERGDGYNWQMPRVDEEDGDGYLDGVAMRRSDDGWVVGYHSNGYTPLIKHWDGRHLVTVVGAKFGGQAILSGVAAVADNDAWAVGQYNHDAGGEIAYRGLVERWDGSSWQLWPLPEPRPTEGFSNYTLRGVAAAATNDVWAVGGNQMWGLILHWDGFAWSVSSSPAVGRANHELRSVYVLASNDVWAVGGDIVTHWDGQQWQVVLNLARFANLYAITAISQDDVWVAGYDGGPISLHWNGKNWDYYRNPDGGSSASSLYGIEAMSEGNIWAVGTFGTSAPLVEHFTCQDTPKSN